jgi:hypothetical protein
MRRTILDMKEYLGSIILWEREKAAGSKCTYRQREESDDEGLGAASGGHWAYLI